MSPVGMRRWRVGLGAVGVLCIGYSGWGILTGGVATAPADTGRWLLGSVLGHDLLIAGVTAAAGWLLARVLPRPVRPAVHGGLLVAGAVVLVALPVLSGRGGHGNPSSNPLDYPRNLLVVLGAVAAGTAVAAALAAVRARREQRDDFRNS